MMSASSWKNFTSTLTILVSAAIVSGCASSNNSRTNSPTLYMHFGIYLDSPQRLVSTRVHLSESIFAAGDGFWQLQGNIQKRGQDFVAELTGSTGQGSGIFKGTLTLEKEVYASG